MSYRSLTLTAMFWLAASLPCQMSGSYTIDPAGTGPRNFKKLNDASLALLQNGVAGPVIVTVADRTYDGLWIIPPIPGVSKSSKVTFKSASYRGAR